MRYWITMFLSLYLSCPAASIKNHQLDSKPIIILTIPKAGSHLIQKAVKLITNREVPWINPNDVLHFDENIHISKEGIYIQHLFNTFDVIKEDPLQKYIKIILIRDPRDVLISQIYHMQQGGEWCWWTPIDYRLNFIKLSFDEKLNESITFPDAYFSIHNFDLKAIEWMQNPDVFVCRFEDLIGPQGGGNEAQQIKTIEALALHMGYSLSRKRIKTIARMMFGSTNTFREGQIGSWQKNFKSMHKELFKQIMGQELIDLGYATDQNW